jgi:hypothetical protein
VRSCDEYGGASAGTMTDTLGAARRYGPLGGFQPSTEVLAGTICSPACGSTSGARTLPADRPGVWGLTRFDIVRRVSVLAVTAAGDVRRGEVDGVRPQHSVPR